MKTLTSILSTTAFSLSVLASAAAMASPGGAEEVTPAHWKTIGSGQEAGCGSEHKDDKAGGEKSCGAEHKGDKAGGEKSCGAEHKGDKKDDPAKDAKKDDPGAEKGCGADSCG